MPTQTFSSNDLAYGTYCFVKLAPFVKRGWAKAFPNNRHLWRSLRKSSVNQSRASRAVKRVIRAAGKTGRVERIATSRSSSGELSSFQTSQTNESNESDETS